MKNSTHHNTDILTLNVTLSIATPRIETVRIEPLRINYSLNIND